MQPDAAMMQGDRCGPASLKPADLRGPCTSQTAGRRELLVPGLPSLASPRPPAPQPLGPRRLPRALGRTHALGSLAAPPRSLRGLSLDALGDPGGPTGRRSPPRPAWRGLAAQRQAGGCPGLSLRAGGAQAQARAHPARGDGPQPGAACLPPAPGAPAALRPPWPPASAPALGGPRGQARAGQGVLETRLGGPAPAQRQPAGSQGRGGLAPLPIALLPRGQWGKGRAPRARCRAVHAPCAAHALPRPAERQGPRLAAAPGCRRPRRSRGGHSRLAKIVDHNVKRRQEGVHSNHRRARVSAFGLPC